MKSLRKRALAKAVGKQYKSDKGGGFSLNDKYGWISFIPDLSKGKIVELINQ